MYFVYILNKWLKIIVLIKIQGGFILKSIGILVEEHSHIKKVLSVIRKACIEIVEGSTVEHKDFYGIIDFIRNYADKYHHSKEEDMLFLEMAEDLGDAVKTGPIQGMLLEHDLGRKYVANLEEALKRHEKGDHESKVDIIANAIGYANLLGDHIQKEDNALYQFAIRQLKNETKEKLNQEFDVFESKEENIKKREKYIEFVKELEEKYL